MTTRRQFLALAGSAAVLSFARFAQADEVEAYVTVYGASWCSACKVLEQALKARKIPFEPVDIEANPSAYAMAKKASGTNAIPLTLVQRGPTLRWIVGSDADAVEKAYRGEG